jgi:stage II sporulation protein D (peptidoglycan lytic transglycosylase)
MTPDEYVAGVLAGESGNFTSPGALQAMAVAARTYALKFLGRHAAEGFDFCDTTHCQDYRPDGGPQIAPLIVDAIESTSGELIWFAGTAAASYYTQNCGGVSEDASALWPDQRAPYLVRHSDAFCPQMPWHSDIRKADLERVFGYRIPSLAITGRTASGRASSVRLGPKMMTSASFRFAVGRRLGWNLVRSDWFEVSDGGDRWTVAGRGGGHGVGLCQAGAEQMGKSGKSYREILAFYYPGTVVGLTAAGLRWQKFSGERVDVLAAGASEGRVTLERAERAAAEIEQIAGRRFARRPGVRLYPTVAAFRDATGEPGWVAASTHGHIVRLQPSADASTLRHEMAHALLESIARPGLPLWFREGLALELVRSGRNAGVQATGAQPADAAFTNARTRAELDRVYAASASAVASLIARYGRAEVLSWMERGIPPEAVRAVTPGTASR